MRSPLGYIPTPRIFRITSRALLTRNLVRTAARPRTCTIRRIWTNEGHLNERACRRRVQQRACPFQVAHCLPRREAHFIVRVRARVRAALHAIASNSIAVWRASDTGSSSKPAMVPAYDATVTCPGCGAPPHFGKVSQLVIVHRIILEKQCDSVAMLQTDPEERIRVQALQRFIRKVAHLGIIIAEHMHNGTCVIGKYT